MRTTTILLMLVCLTWTSGAHAQTDFRGLRLKPGDVVYVTSPAGVEISGPLEGITPMSIALAGHTFKPEPGLKIERRGDPLWDGAAIGAAIGVGVGALLSTGECGADWHAWQCALAGAAWGTLLGTLIDLKHKGRTQIFVGVATTHSLPADRRLASVSLRVSF
jgi:hypothetical protein